MPVWQNISFYTVAGFITTLHKKASVERCDVYCELISWLSPLTSVSTLFNGYLKQLNTLGTWITRIRRIAYT